jgi:uncharacterized protein YbaA (DUF1428 family)
MPQYVDGYVLPVPRDKVAEYQRMARVAAKVWKEHGALEYRECVGEDMGPVEGLVGFEKLSKAKPDEVPIFAYIVFKSRAHRDKVNAAVMKDPRLANMGHETMPFDCKRMAFGGFDTIVHSKAD